MRWISALSALALTVLLCTNHAHAATSELQLVSDAWVPFTGPDDRPHWAQDIVHEALRRAEITATTTIVPTAEFNDALLSDSYSGSAATWFSEERTDTLLYSAAYLENRLVIIGRQGGDVSATSFTDLNGKRLGVVEGYAYGIDTNNPEKPVFIPGANLQNNLEKLLREEIDYMLVDELVARNLVDNYPAQVKAHLAIGDHPLLTRSLHLTIRKDIPNAENIIQRFNETILIMMSDGTYNRILGIRWLQIDIDGDGILDNVLSDNNFDDTPSAAASGYLLLTPEQASEEAKTKAGSYYLGGNNFEEWEDVQRYKGSSGPMQQDNGQTGSQVLRFNF